MTGDPCTACNGRGCFDYNAPTLSRCMACDGTGRAPAAQQAPAPAAEGSTEEFAAEALRLLSAGRQGFNEFGSASVAWSVFVQAAPALVERLARRILEAPAPAPATPAAAEPLSLDRYTRTAVQVALWSYDADQMPVAADAEDVALRDVQALLTPAGRRELARDILAPLGTLTECADTPTGRLARAAELLEHLGLVNVTMTPLFDALTAGQVVHERIEGHEYHRSATLRIGKVLVQVGETRPASLDDARRLLEK